jgi:glycosyltransferase involved in cell wall biosynthesis
MIRVLQVFHGMDCGGAETMIMNLYRHIDRTKVQFDFLVHTTKKCFFDDEIKKLGGNIYSVPYYKITNGRQYKAALKQFFRSHPEIKIVHGHLGSCAHIYLQIAKQHGCYAIAHSHNTKPKGFSLKNLLYRIFTYKTRKVADYFFGCSIAAAEYRFGYKIAHSSKCDILKNAIDVGKFAYSDKYRKEIRDEFNLENKIVIGHVGRFNTQKNHTFLIDIFKAIHDKRPDSVLILVGIGNLMPAIKQKVESLGLNESVIFAGLRSDVHKMMSAFDVFLFPSLYEGLPVTLVEAQAAGLHAVCSDTIPKEVEVTNLVDFRSLNEPTETWANAVLKYSEPYERLNMQQEIIKAGYDIQTTAKWLENFYVSI